MAIEHKFDLDRLVTSILSVFPTLDLFDQRLSLELYRSVAEGQPLAGRLIDQSSDLNLKDDKYKSPPLGWAIHGWCDPPAGNRGRQREAVVLLVTAGARVEPEWLESEKVRANPAMLAALRAETL